jgi:hypothetical protein
MPTSPTAIDALPAEPSTSDPANFATEADAFLAALPTFRTQTNAAATNVYNNAVEAEADAVAADASADAAAASAAAADISADASAASAASALGAPGTNATSTTSLTIGTGAQSLTIQTGKLYSVGQTVVIARTSAPATTQMTGVVTAHDSGTGALDVTVGSVVGSGTHTDWTVSLSASQSLPFASEAEAEAGVATDKAMNALRVAQAIAALVPAELIAIVQDQKSNGTHGDGLTASGWRTRTLNTEVSDPDGLVTIASNQITINEPGTYEIEAFGGVHSSTSFTTTVNARSRLYDISGSAVISQGENVKASFLGTDGAETFALTHVVGVIEVATTKTIEFQTYPSATGLTGRAVTTGEVEVYSTVIIRKKA